MQKYGLDFTETYASVARIDTIRLFLWYANQYDLDIFHIDVGNAYLQADLEEGVSIYMEQPEGYNSPSTTEDLVCLLQKPLYGLRQAGNRWAVKRDSVLLSIGFKKSLLEPSLYFRKSFYANSQSIVILVQVDDFLLIGSAEDCQTTVSRISTQVDITCDTSAKWFIGLKISRNRESGELSLSQKTIIEDLIFNYNLKESRPVKVPFSYELKRVMQVKPSGDAQISNVPYRNLIGSLMYIARMTRPDILYHTQFLSKFNDRHTAVHWKAALSTVKYLKSTKKLKVTYSRIESSKNDCILKFILGYCDTSHGDDLEDGLSTAGHVFIAGGGMLAIQVGKQDCPALSSTEDEYLSYTPCSQHATWIRNVFLETQVIADESDCCPILISTDGKSAYQSAMKESTAFPKTKHIALKYHFIRKLISDKIVSLQWIPGTENPADLTTKPLGSILLAKHRSAMIR